MGFKKIDFSGNVLNNVVNALNEMQESTFRTVSLTILVAELVSLVLFLVLILVAKNRWMIGHSVVALLISYMVFPLLLLLLENLFPMILSVAMLALFGGVIWFEFAYHDSHEDGAKSKRKSLGSADYSKKKGVKESDLKNKKELDRKWQENPNILTIQGNFAYIPN